MEEIGVMSMIVPDSISQPSMNNCSRFHITAAGAYPPRLDIGVLAWKFQRTR